MSSKASLLTSTGDTNLVTYAQYIDHISEKRIDTNGTILEHLKRGYSEYHVTEVKEDTVSLFEFAAAGRAELTFDGDTESFIATRTWKAAGGGSKRKPHTGRLEDDYRFARFHYIWEKKQFIVHYVQYQDAFSSPTKLFYILAPRATSTIQAAHCVETDALILAAGEWTSKLHDEIFVFDDGYWNKSKELWKSVTDSSWDDVILDPVMKKSIIDDVLGFFDNQSIYNSFAMPWKRGIILHGVPGNGKTVSIKALMSSLYDRADPVPSLYVKSLETNCQTPQYSISKIFSWARKMAPCLLVFEDLDSLVSDDVRSYFLNEVDGLESNDGILMIGSTNHLASLDPAISKRPSRFDRKYYFKIPGHEERRLYVEYWKKKLLRNEAVEFPDELTDVVADLTEGFSFAYLKELFIVVLMSLVRGDRGPEDFEVVNKEDAVNADKTAIENKSPEAEDMCSCKPLCEKCNKPLPPLKDDSNAKHIVGEDGNTDKAPEPRKMLMPEVDVPLSLADNALLKIFKFHVQALISEMDNSADDDEPEKEDGPSADRGNKGMLTGRPRRSRAARC